MLAAMTLVWVLTWGDARWNGGDAGEYATRAACEKAAMSTMMSGKIVSDTHVWFQCVEQRRRT